MWTRSRRSFAERDGTHHESRFTILTAAKRDRLEPRAYLRQALLRLGVGETAPESLLPDGNVSRSVGRNCGGLAPRRRTVRGGHGLPFLEQPSGRLLERRK